MTQKNIDSGPTYKMEPDENERFYPSKVKTEIKKLVDEELANFTYDQNGASKKANDLAILIRKLLKQGTGDARMKRYKLLVQVVIGELKGQGIRIMSQCLWDEKLDNYTDCTFQKENYFCTVMVWGCYNE